MTETTVSADLLQALEIVTELGIDVVGQNLGVFAVDNVALTIEEPGWDLVLGGVLDDGDNTLELFGGEFTSWGMLDPTVSIKKMERTSLGKVDIGLLADKVGVAATDTLYLGEGVLEGG